VKVQTLLLYMSRGALKSCCTVRCDINNTVVAVCIDAAVSALRVAYTSYVRLHVLTSISPLIYTGSIDECGR